VARQILFSLSVLFLACRSSDTIGYTEADHLPNRYVGDSYRAWLVRNTLVVEVEQIPGLNVADIECAVVGQDIHLSPTRISSGGPGMTTFEVPLPSFHSPKLWVDHLYWVTFETFTPIWSGKPTEPTQRVRVLLGEVPSDPQEIRRPTSGCS
jgi:hypothetical protein